MPTTRPRHLVTETDELAAALNDAGRRWPHLSRAQLVVRLALEGHKAALDERERRRERRRAAVRAHAGALKGVYPPGHLEKLRDEWPE